MIKRVYNKIFNKKYHWYRVKFEYKKISDKKPIVIWTQDIGLKYQDDILNHRELKKSQSVICKGTLKVPREVLCNGVIFAEPTCYLGKM